MDRNALERLTPTISAFIGDAVYTLDVRKRVAAKTDVACGTLHLAATKYVNAKAQAALFDKLTEQGFFTEEEADIARRAKNAHLHSRAKTATPSDYHKATALEAVIGYLELSDSKTREAELLAECARLTGLD